MMARFTMILMIEREIHLSESFRMPGNMLNWKFNNCLKYLIEGRE